MCALIIEQRTGQVRSAVERSIHLNQTFAKREGVIERRRERKREGERQRERERERERARAREIEQLAAVIARCYRKRG